MIISEASSIVFQLDLWFLLALLVVGLLLAIYRRDGLFPILLLLLAILHALSFWRRGQ
ncbi:MAG: hypothetical protein AB7L91_17365 [Dehalococcoidia bacterium]